MNAAAGPYAGLDRFEARKRVVEDLKALGLLERVERPHALSRDLRPLQDGGRAARFDAVVLKMKPLARKRPCARWSGRAIPSCRIISARFYLDWMANIRDWCISRQLWWGHRIPIWHCAKCKAMTPATSSRVKIVDGHARAAGLPTKCDKCGSDEARTGSRCAGHVV